MEINCHPFYNLSLDQLYEIIRLRNEVFVVEQNCVFQDADDKDQHAYHICIYEKDILIGYSRLLPPGLSYQQASIGRVVTKSQVRNTGVGHVLIKASIENLYQIFGRQDIKIGAQMHLKKFYQAYGFEQNSDIYDEDGIDHIEMLLKI